MPTLLPVALAPIKAQDAAKHKSRQEATTTHFEKEKNPHKTRSSFIGVTLYLLFSLLSLSLKKKYRIR